MAVVYGPGDPYREGEPWFWDPAYFFPKYFKVQPRKGGRNIPFILWDEQSILAQAVVRCYLERKWLLHVKPRKEGSSTFFTNVLVQNITFREGVQAVIIAQRDDVTRQLGRTANRAFRSLPDNMKPKRMPGVKRTIELPDQDSLLSLVTVGQDDPGRGFTGIQALLATEICKWGIHNGENAWVSMLSNLPDKNDGAFVVAESTPLHHDDELQKLWEKADEPDSPWLKVFVPWTMLHGYAVAPYPGWEPTEMVADYANEWGLTVEQAFWMQTIGLPKSNNSLVKFRAEYPISELDCWVMAGDKVFDVMRLKEILDYLDKGTNSTEQTGEYQVFKPPQKSHRYVVFCDPAGSWAKRDKFAIQVVDLANCEQVAEYLGHLDAYKCARMLADIGKNYNMGKVYIESNGVGEAVLSALLRLRYPRIFHRTSGQSLSGERLPGWHSNKKTKTEAVGLAQELLDDKSCIINSHRLCRQMTSYGGQWDKLSRDAQGGHFDLVASWCGAMWGWRREGGARGRYREETTQQRADRAWREVLGRIEAGGENNRAAQTRWGRHL